MSIFLETNKTFDDDAIKFYDYEQQRLKLFMDKMNLPKQTKKLYKPLIKRTNNHKKNKEKNKSDESVPNCKIITNQMCFLCENRKAMNRSWVSDFDCIICTQNRLNVLNYTIIIRPEDNVGYTRHEKNGRVTWTK